MLKKFFRKYAWAMFIALTIYGAFVVGFFVGKANCKEIPVFIEARVSDVEVAEESEEEQETVEQNTVELTATAYCSCEKCCGIWATKRPLDENGEQIVYTASGAVAQAGRTLAVDPTVFPYGTVLEINGVEYVAEDCGGAIKGNRIDVYFEDHQAAREFGRQNVTAIVKGVC